MNINCPTSAPILKNREAETVQQSERKGDAANPALSLQARQRGIGVVQAPIPSR